MTLKIAVAHLVESRPDFLTQRQQFVNEEVAALNWMREEFELVESGLLKSAQEVIEFARIVALSGAVCLIIHIPIWTDPIFTIKLYDFIALPILLLGNMRPETSSIVGLLGAGGALDQVGCRHERVFTNDENSCHHSIRAFIIANAAIAKLKGQTLGLFGSRSLGIFTTVADPAQWHKLFKVDLQIFDQSEIVEKAQAISAKTVDRHTSWLLKNLNRVEFGGSFSPEALDRQMRSYLATRSLLDKYGLNFVGVKCQPELSDGYASQCVSHMLMNGNYDAEGYKIPFVHACESDADGALSMQILHLLSGGKPTALLDLRWFDNKSGVWVMTNCGAISASFCSNGNDPTGLSSFAMKPHVFGLGGGGAIPGIVKKQKVTLARLCRRNGEYLMFIVAGEVQNPGLSIETQITNVFPRALIKTSCGMDFLKTYASNHIHMVSGLFVDELIYFCQLNNIAYRLWE